MPVIAVMLGEEIREFRRLANHQPRPGFKKRPSPVGIRGTSDIFLGPLCTLRLLNLHIYTPTDLHRKIIKESIKIRKAASTGLQPSWC